MANAIRYCMTEESHTGDTNFIVARPSIFGNPFTHIKNKKTLALKKVRDRHTAVRLYGKYFDEMLKEDKDFREAFDRMDEAFKSNDAIYIGCWCHLDEECHGDIIIQKLNQRLVKEKIEQLKNARKKEKQEQDSSD